MPKIRKKKFIDANVYDKAKERIRYIYSQYDNIAVSFSGGKDSTAVLNCTLEVAKELVKFFDEEAIHPPTIDYVHRIAKNPDIDFEWFCLEFKHRNACSNEEPFWYCWDKDKSDKWVRELPVGVNLITEHPKFKKGMSFQEFSPNLGDVRKGRSIILTGMRAEESLRRLRVMSMKKNDNYITGIQKTISQAHPIYDWKSSDVWIAVTKFGWDYNKTYDVFNKTKQHNKFLQQRVCPPFGEEPLRGLWIYAECFPEMWHKMLNRVAGVGTAWRYANTDLYGYGKITKPENVKTFKEYIKIILESYDKVSANKVKITLNSIIKLHYNKTNDIIHETKAHPVSGVSWEHICKIIIKGDFKNRTKATLMEQKLKAQKDLGITLEQAELRYGKK